MGCGCAKAKTTPLFKFQDGSQVILPAELSREYVPTGRYLGRGHFSEVHEVQCRKKPIKWACKVIDREKSNNKALENEISILQKVGHHANILELSGVYFSQQHAFLVLELMEGGELFDYLVECGTFSERRAAGIIKGIAEAVYFLHSQGIVHRDLKPENLLLTSTEKDGVLKIADFGLATPLRGFAAQSNNSMAGTIAYTSPEMLKYKEFSTAVDMWSLGIILYIVLYGFHPYDPSCQKTTQEIIKSIEEDEVDYDVAGFEDMSSEVKDLIKKCLSITPNKRCTVTQFLNHPWILNAAEHTTKTVERRASLLKDYNKEELEDLSQTGTP